MLIITRRTDEKVYMVVQDEVQQYARTKDADTNKEKVAVADVQEQTSLNFSNKSVEENEESVSSSTESLKESEECSTNQQEKDQSEDHQNVDGQEKENITVHANKKTGLTFKIHVLEVKGGQVRIGIDAPKEFMIFREEILPEHLHHLKDDPDSTAKRRKPKVFSKVRRYKTRAQEPRNKKLEDNSCEASNSDNIKEEQVSS